MNIVTVYKTFTTRLITKKYNWIRWKGSQADSVKTVATVYLSINMLLPSK